MIQAGDIVFCNKGGRLFHAKVIGTRAAGVLYVEPIERNVAYRQVKASEIADHWATTSPPAVRIARRTRT